MNEKIGLNAIWNNDNFNKGQAEYMSKMLSASDATGAISGTMNQMGFNAQGVGGLLSSLAGSLGLTSGQMIGLGAAIGIGVGAFKMLSNAVSEFVDYMIMGEDSAINMASRVNEMNLAAQAMGQQVGYSGEQIQSLVKQLTSMEISGKDANQVVADFARHGLNMSDVLKLATVAENASVLAGKSATETFTDMASAIEMMRIRSLKTNGIIFDANEAYQKMADTLGKDVKALTDTEQQQAFLNMTIERGANLAGLHEVAMRTAAEQMDKMSSKTLPGLKTALGAPFQAAFYNVIRGANDIIVAFTKMITEGGALYPLMVKIGAVFEIMTEPIRALGETITNFSSDTLGSFAQGITNIISAAIDWGANLVINFANGMINAASTVLTAAINFVAGLLTFWMAPGSPPKFIPDIDEWGSEAMEEYLEGFTEADFSVLNDLQNPIEAILGSLTDMGDLTKQAAAQLYVDLSEGMIQAIAGGGLTDAILAQLSDAAGIYGEQLTDLAKKEFELAAAQNAVSDAEKMVSSNEQAVTDAEKAKENAEKRAGKAEAEVNQGLLEYNQMLRGGASKEDLKAKLASINASKKAQVEATKDVDAKQVAIDLAKEQLEASRAQLEATKQSATAINEQVRALQDMLKVMIDLNKEQIVAVTPEPVPAAPAEPAVPGGGTVAPVTPGGAVTPFDPSKITDAWKKAIDEQVALFKAKYGPMWENLKAKALEAWDTITKAWKSSGLEAVWNEIKKAAGTAWEWIGNEAGRLASTLERWWAKISPDALVIWNELKREIMAIWNSIIAPIINSLWNFLIPSLKRAWQIVVEIFNFALSLIGGIIQALADLIRGKPDEAMKHLETILGNFGLFVQNLMTNLLQIVVGALSALLQIFLTIFGNIGQAIIDWGKGVWDYLFGGSLFPDILNAFITFVSDFLENVGEWLSGIWDTITTISENILETWNTFWDDTKQKATDIWNAIVTWVSTKISLIKTNIGTVTGEIGSAWTTFWDGVSTKATDIWNTIYTWVSTKITEIKTFIGTVTGEISAAWTTFWDGVSLKVTEIWGAIVIGVGTKIQDVKDAIDAMFNDPTTGIWTKFTGWINDMIKTGGDLIGGLITGITGAVAGAVTAVVKAVGDIIEAAKKVFKTQNSPSELFKELGFDVMKGLELGIQANMVLPQLAMRNAMVQTLAPAAAIPVTMGATNNYYQPRISMINNINNGMAVPALEALITRTVRKGMKR